jgi:hypothetical protein
MVLSLVAQLYNILIAGDTLNQYLIFQLILLLQSNQLLLLGFEGLLISDIFLVLLEFDP